MEIEQYNSINTETSPGDLSAQQAEEAGSLHFRLCQLAMARTQLRHALSHYKHQEHWIAYSRVLPLLLRIAIEMENECELRNLWQEFEELRKQPDFPYTSRAHYALAIYFNYAKDPVRSHEHFKSALSLALSSQCTESEIYARVGLAGYYYTAGNTEIALSEISKSKQLYLLNPELNNDLFLSTLIFESVIWRSQGQYHRSLECLSDAQSQAKAELNLYMVLNILLNLSLTYTEMGELEKAKSQAEFAQNLASGDLVRFNRALMTALAKIVSNDSLEHDVYLEEGANPKIRIRGRQSIALKNQYLLSELLKLLGQYPRQPWSKEEIVEALWGESYHPLKHDNKLYVTIRRLRCLVEINEKKPEIVVKNQKGYLLNPALSFGVGQPT